MIQTSVMFALLAVGLIGVQGGQFGGELGGHIGGTPVQYKECTESEFDGPLARTSPKKYGLMMYIKQSAHSDVYVLTVNVDGSQGKKEEPKDVVVMHMDPSVNVETLTVLKERTAKPSMTLPLSIESVCQDSAKQLLVVKFAEEIADRSVLEMMFTLYTPIRSDNKGIHKEGDSIKASFAQQEARLSIPSFDDDKYKTDIRTLLAVDGIYEVSSETCEIEYQTLLLDWNLVDFTEMTSASLSKLSFKLAPAK